MSEELKDPFEIENHRCAEGRYFQTSSQSPRCVFLLSNEVRDIGGPGDYKSSEIVLTVHRRMDRPVQIYIGDRKEVQALYTACKKYLQRVEE